MLKHILSGILFSTALAATPIFAAPSAMPATLTSAEINTLGTVAAIDQDEIVLGAMALHKHASNTVDELARMMINQHGENLAQIMQLSAQYHVASLNTSGAKQFLASGQKDLRTLGALQGKAFETGYANAMVSGHEGALKLIDTTLLPSATTPAIKQFMTATRAAVAMHLAHAKTVQQELKS